MKDKEDPKVVDFATSRNRDKKPELSVECPRCGKSNFMRDQKCQHCGVWFSGEAFQFAPSEEIPSKRRTLLMMIGWFTLSVALLLLIAAVTGGGWP